MIFLKKLFASWFPESSDVDTSRRVVMINIVAITGFVNLIPLGIAAFKSDHITLGCVDMALAAVMAFLVIDLPPFHRAGFFYRGA